MQFLLSLCAIIVCVIGIFSLWPKKPVQKISISKIEFRYAAAWMMAYFGTFRPKSYYPLAREESILMLDFLERLDGELVGALKIITKQALLANRLPDIVEQEDFHFIFLSLAIAQACCKLRLRCSTAA